MQAISPQERLAETVLEPECEADGIKRPHQPAERDVLLRIGEPIVPGRHEVSYLPDARPVRHAVAG